MSARRRTPPDTPHAHRYLPHRQRRPSTTVHSPRYSHAASTSSEDQQQHTADLHDFAAHLANFALYFRDVESDGNCLFRAFSDQLYGVEAYHQELRTRCVSYLRRHQDDFAPFLEQDRSYAAYLAEMARGGVWGGNLELQALSMALSVNIRIHRLPAGTPSFDIRNHHHPNARVVHLSYHRDQHYASVRPKFEKYAYGPANHAPLPPLASDVICRTATTTATTTTTKDPDGTTTPVTNTDSDTSSTYLSVQSPQNIFEDISESARDIQRVVSDALQVIRRHCVCCDNGNHVESLMKRYLLPQNGPSHAHRRDCVCDCHRVHPRRPPSHQQKQPQSCSALEAEAMAILELLDKADRHRKNAVSLTQTRCSERGEQRVERERKHMIDDVSEASVRAAALEQHVRLLCQCRSRPHSSSVVSNRAKPEDRTSRRPSKKSLQEAYRMERKGRRRQQDQEPQARPAKYESRIFEVFRSTRVDF